MPLIARMRTLVGGMLLSLTLAACDHVASLDAPLPATDGAEVEEGLAGVWALADSDPDSVLMLSVAETEYGTFDIEMLFTPGPTEEKNEGLPFAAGRWEATPTVMDGRTYYSGRILSIRIFPVEDDESAAWLKLAGREVYHVGRAEIAPDGTLMLHLLADPDLAPLDPATTILDPGNGELIAPVQITHADPEQLRAFIIANVEDNIFSWDLGPFVRISGAPSSEGSAEIPAAAKQ